LAKVIGQLIPSENYSEYKQALRTERKSGTGYMYYLGDYAYAGLVGSREAFKVGSRAGINYPQVSLSQEKQRHIFLDATVLVKQSLDEGGAAHPECGPRNKCWWFDRMGPGYEYWNNFMMKHSMDEMNKGRIPSWGIDKNIIVVEKGSKLVEKRDQNTLALIDETDGTKGGFAAFDNPVDCAIDGLYFWVTDRGNKALYKIRTSDMETVEYYTKYNMGQDNFPEIARIDVSNNLMCLSVIAGTGIMVLDKYTLELIAIADVRFPGGDETPIIQDICLTRNMLYVSDFANQAVVGIGGKYWNATGWFTIKPLYPDMSGSINSCISDESYVWVIDTIRRGIYRISMDLKELLAIHYYTNIGMINLGWSGEFLIMSTQSLLGSSLAVIDKYSLDIYKEINNVGDPKVNYTNGSCGPNQVLWEGY